MNKLNEEPIRRDGPGTWNFDIKLPQENEISELEKHIYNEMKQISKIKQNYGT